MKLIEGQGRETCQHQLIIEQHKRTHLHELNDQSNLENYEKINFNLIKYLEFAIKICTFSGKFCTNCAKILTDELNEEEFKISIKYFKPFSRKKLTLKKINFLIFIPYDDKQFC